MKNLLRKSLLGIALAMGVVTSMAIEVPQAKADIIFLNMYRAYSTKEAAMRELPIQGSWRVQYVRNGPGGAGWYITR